MAFVFLNENPAKIRTGDCVVRAIAKIEDMDWYDVYIELCAQGMEMTDWGDSNRVWMSYLKDIGYKITLLPTSCPNCYSVADFAREHPKGEFLAVTGNHIVAVVDGNYYDTWDSGNEIVIYYFVKEQDNGTSISNV